MKRTQGEESTVGHKNSDSGASSSFDDFRRAIEEGLSASIPGDEPCPVSFGFLCLECPEKDLGRATAVRNFWAWKCYGNVYS